MLKDTTCSFCKSKSSKLLMIDYPSLICENCLAKHRELFREAEQDEFQTKLTPRKIKKILDESVVGQEKAKRQLAVCVYNHQKIINQTNADVKIEKINMLLVGPTGCGKTLLIQALEDIVRVPIVIVDATSLTEAGYVGEDVESILYRLLKAANNDIEAAQKGIVYIDEIDKIGIKSETNRSITRDVSGEGVQQALLKIIEGHKVSVPLSGSRRHVQQESIIMDTSNIMFVCGGAFPDIEKIALKRNHKNRVGFDLTHNEDLSYEIAQDDIIKFGMIPEFVGRFAAIVQMSQLTETELLKILTEPKNAIVKQIKQLFNLDNASIEFTPGALKRIVELANKAKSGARDLKSIIYRSLMDIMFTVPDNAEPRHILIDTKDIDSTPQCMQRKG